MFKNLVIYRLVSDPIFNRENLQAFLQKFEYTPCGSNDEIKVGWTSPTEPDGLELFYESKGHYILNYFEEERKVPAKALNIELKKKIKKIEEANNKKLNSKEKASLKDEVLRSMLPRAFSSTRSTTLWIDSRNKFIYVDAGSEKKAETALNFLRKTLGTLGVVPLSTNNLGTDVFSEWILDDMVPYGFKLGFEATLTSLMEHGGEIAAKDQDLQIEEIKSLLQSGQKVVTRVGLQFDEHMTFVLDDTFKFKKIKFGKEFYAANNDIDEDKLMRMMADYELEIGEISKVIPVLLEAFGGEKKAA